jgi:hypothetical protein
MVDLRFHSSLTRNEVPTQVDFQKHLRAALLLPQPMGEPVVITWWSANADDAAYAGNHQIACAYWESLNGRGVSGEPGGATAYSPLQANLDVSCSGEYPAAFQADQTTRVRCTSVSRLCNAPRHYRTGRAA